MQLGVDVEGRGDVPLALHHAAVGVDPADVGGGHLLPPQAPRVDQEAAVVLRPRDVAGDVLAEAAAGQDPERAGQRLLGGEVTPIGGVTFGDHTAVPPARGISVKMLIGFAPPERGPLTRPVPMV